MAVSAKSAARYLGELSSWSLSNLKMQKILYMAHMYHLGVTQKPLITGAFEAWDYGPVHADLYFDARIFGSSPVKDVFHGSDLPTCQHERASIEAAYNALMHFSAGQLVDLTHQVDGAWYKNYVPGARRIVIPDEDIVAEYNIRVAA